MIDISGIEELDPPRMLSDSIISPVQYISFLERTIDMESILSIGNAQMGSHRSNMVVEFQIDFKHESRMNRVNTKWFNWGATNYSLEKDLSFREDSLELLQQRIDSLIDIWEKVKVQYCNGKK